jgi:archaellum component FlaC
MRTKRINTIKKAGSARKDSDMKKYLQEFRKEILHQFHMISEGLIDQIKLLAEGHSGIIQRLDRVDTRLDGMETRLDRVETRFDGVENRLDGVETRLDAVDISLDRLAKENERQHEETRALVKISFSELDRRISNLELQVKDLQEWRKQIEASSRV